MSILNDWYVNALSIPKTTGNREVRAKEPPFMTRTSALVTLYQQSDQPC